MSVPYGVYGGIVADDAEVEQALFGAVRARADECQVKYVELRAREAGGLDLPESDSHVTFEGDLPARPEE